MQHVAHNEYSRRRTDASALLVPHRTCTVLAFGHNANQGKGREAYDHAFLTVTNSRKSPNALGQSLGFANPVATLTTPYIAFACSSAAHVRKICTHVYHQRVRNG
jgi:hypothetical protein